MSKAFLGLPLPDGVLPDAQVSPDPRECSDEGNRSLTDTATTCPDGLVEEVLWGLFRGLTAPVTGGNPGFSGTSGVHHA